MFFGWGVFEDFHFAGEEEAFEVEAVGFVEVEGGFGVFAVVGDVAGGGVC